jgi:hypothetical protein
MEHVVVLVCMYVFFFFNIVYCLSHYISNTTSYKLLLVYLQLFLFAVVILHLVFQMECH